MWLPMLKIKHKMTNVRVLVTTKNVTATFINFDSFKTLTLKRSLSCFLMVCIWTRLFWVLCCLMEKLLLRLIKDLMVFTDLFLLKISLKEALNFLDLHILLITLYPIGFPKMMFYSKLSTSFYSNFHKNILKAHWQI